MAVQRRVNFLSQQRVDVPDMRSIESAVSNDFDQLIQGLVTGTSQGYVMRGFNILMAGAIGSASSSLLMQVDPGAVLHIAASQSGTILMVPAGTPAQQLNQATNPANVVGAFTPSSINYVTIDYTRFIDPTTSAQVYIWDPSSSTETTKFAPRAQILEFVINISTSTPTANQLPIATVLTDGANLVVSITDARWMFCSLATGGLSPDLTYSYPWTQGRIDSPSTSTSDSIDPFTGADKSIGSLKELLNAMLTTFKEIKGTHRWYTSSPSASFPAIYQNAELNVVSGGTWIHSSLGHLELKGGSTLTRFGFDNNLVFSPFGVLLSTEAKTATVTDGTDITFTSPAASTINIGDTLTIGATTLNINTVTSQSIVKVDQPGFANGSGQSASLKHYSSFDLTSDQVLYILFPSSDTAVTYGYGGDGLSPVVSTRVASLTSSTITVTVDGNYSTGPGKILVSGEEFTYTSYSSITKVFSGISPNPQSSVAINDHVYQLDNAGIGYYHTSTPSKVPGIDGFGATLGAERVFWIAYYDGSSNIFLKEEKLSAGESIAVGDTLSTAILTYIGMPNSATNNPTYDSDIRGTAQEDLTDRISVLTDCMGDAQEDRSAYLRSSSPVSWDGSTLTFIDDIVIEIINTKSGIVTTHTLPAASIYSPAIVAGQINLPINGYTAWVSVNRLATSETLSLNITPSSAIPAQTEANKDVFVLFKAVGTSGSASLYLPFIKQLIAAGQTVSIGASGSGSGNGEGGDFGLDSLTYSASFADAFDTIPTLSSSAVDMSQTNAIYSVTGKYFTVSYDANKTLTSNSSTTMHLVGGAPAFTVKVGDVVSYNGQARKITVLGSINSDGGTGTPFTIEAAFTVNPSTSACIVSQAVYTVDINNYTNNSTEESLFTAYSGSNLSDMLLDYDDSASGSLPNLTATPKIAYTASSTGTASDYTSVNSRSVLGTTQNTTSFPTASTKLYIRFFANPSLTGNGTVNLLNYEAFIHNQNSLSTTGFALNQAYCFTNASTTTVNCTQPTVVSGKTQISGLPSYSVGLNSGTPNGQLEIFVNGQKIPRFTAGVTKVGDAYYTEINNTTIQLDSDYSGFDFAVEVIRPVGVIDSSSQNSTNISILQGILGAVYTAIVGSSAQVTAGVAGYSSLQSAITAVPSGSTILVLAGSYTENITLTKQVSIFGQGRSTLINGIFAYNVGSSYSLVRNIKVNGNVTINAAVTGVYFNENWLSTGSTLTDSGSGNLWTYITE